MHKVNVLVWRQNMENHKGFVIIQSETSSE